MGKLSLAARKMIASIIVVSLVFIAVGVALELFSVGVPFGLEVQYIKAVPFCLGVILMAGLNVAKVFLIERAVNRTVEIGSVRSGKTYIRLQYFLRFFLTGVVLIVAALTPVIDIWGAVAGVLTFSIAALSLKFMKIEEPDSPQGGEIHLSRPNAGDGKLDNEDDKKEGD
jgi:hypothetical protein